MPKTEIKTEKRRRVGIMQSALMISVAIVIDIVNIILLLIGIGLVINRFITIFVFMVFAFWFALNGVNFLTGRMSLQKITRFLGPAFGEILPVIGALPLWSLGIWLTLRSVKKEDEIGQYKNKKGIVRKAKTAIKVVKVARMAKKVISRGR